MRIAPVCAPSVKVPLVLPAQTADPPVTEPASVTGSTVTVAVAELLASQTPLFNTARYIVVTERFMAA